MSKVSWDLKVDYLNSTGLCDLGLWTSDFGPRTLDLGLWTLILDFGPWTLELGLWTWLQPMKNPITMCLLALLFAISGIESKPQTPTAASHEVFWQKFRQAVINTNKTAVADMSQFPISMPYGMATVRNRSQLLRRYRQVFNHDSSAAKCFVDALPTLDPVRPNEFTVGCKNSAGHEVVIYSFTRGRNGWKFTGLDNLNE